MKNTKYIPKAIKIIRIIIEIFGIQINFLVAANPDENRPVNHLSTCIICSNSASSNQKDVLLNEIILLAPTTPAEATFTDEAINTEINLAPTTPAEASFDNDPEFISTSVLEYLAPATPAEADFND